MKRAIVALALCGALFAGRVGAQILSPILFGNSAASPGYTPYTTWTDYGSHQNTASQTVWSDYGSHQE